MDQKDKMSDSHKSPKKGSSKRLKSESARAHHHDSPKASNSSSSADTYGRAEVNNDCFAMEKKGSCLYKPGELHKQFEKKAEELKLLCEIMLKASVKDEIYEKQDSSRKLKKEEMMEIKPKIGNKANRSSGSEDEISAIEDEEIESKLPPEFELAIASLKEPVPAFFYDILSNNKKCLQWVFNTILQMKKCSRLDKHHLKNSRDRVAQWKQKVDEKRLKYQNVLTEVAYLRNETKSCLEVECEADKIELDPIEVFYKEASPEISNEEVTSTDDHQLTLARLKWELKKRKMLVEKLKKAEDTKGLVQVEVKDLMDCYNKVEPMLRTIQELIAVPFERMGGPPAQEYYVGYRDAKCLPQPLRYIYIRVKAYSEVWNDTNGGLKTQVNIIPRESFNSEIHEPTSNCDLPVDKQGYPETKKVASVPEDKEYDELLEKYHPFSIQWIIECEGNILILVFSYVICLNIVTVKVQKIYPDESLCIPSNKLLQSDGFLDNLFPGDNGTKNPHSMDHKVLWNSNSGTTDVYSVFNYTVGKPYIWAQKLANLDSEDDDNFENSTTSEVQHDFRCAKYLNEIVSAIKLRMKARIFLSSQIAILASKGRPPNAVASILTTNIVSCLKYFKDGNPKDINFYPDHEVLVQEQIYDSDCLLYKLEIERGSALLCALIIISPDYPLKTPVFLLFLYWKGSSSNNINSVDMRELEQEINVYFVDEIPEEHKYYTLLCQVYHLRACLDVYLENHPASDVIEGPREFAKDKITSRVFRGRSHSRPYKYVSSLKLFIPR